MKNWIWMILIAFFFLCHFAHADTCPEVAQFTQETYPTAPAGWTALHGLTPAILPGQSIPTTSFPGQNYFFVSAIHSLNPNFYNLQVICVYQCTPNAVDCSPLVWVSNARYRQPARGFSPWAAPFNLMNTLVCTPKDNNPLECPFSLM